MDYFDRMQETYDWLTERFGERVAECLVPDLYHTRYPLSDAELRDAHRHVEEWAAKEDIRECAN